MAIFQQDVAYQFRPDNKEAHWSTIESYDELFSQYVETDIFQVGQTGFEAGRSNATSDALDAPTSSNGSNPLTTSPLLTWESSTDSSGELWQRHARSSGQKPDRTQTSIYPQSSGKGAASEPELYSLDNLLTGAEEDNASTSAPHSPELEALHIAKRPVNFSYPRRPSTAIQKSVRKQSISPKMMRPSSYRPGYQDVWAKRVEEAAERMNLITPHTAVPASPPPTGHMRQQSAHNGFDGLATNGMSYETGISTNPYNGTVTPPISTQFSQNSFACPGLPLSTPLSSPTIENPSCQPQLYHNGHAAPYFPSRLDSVVLQTPPRSDKFPSAWDNDQNEVIDFTFPASPFPDTNHWPLNAQVNHTPSTPSFANQRQQNEFAHANNDLASSGLMISCGPTLDGNNNMQGLAGMMQDHSVSGGAPVADMTFSFSPTTSHTQGTSYTHSAPLPIPATPTHSRRPYSMAAYTPLPPRSRSPSPHSSTSDSQQSLQPRTRRSSSKGTRVYSSIHQRRKSSSHVSSSSRRQSGAGGVGFVNFTPDDSRKILTGVAPSGSSKTKARREKEAADKRRKLSQAAARAIVEAGGDLGRLREEGLLVLES